MLKPEDRFAILDVLAAANRAADDKDVPATMHFYTSNGTIEGDMQAPAEGADFATALQAIYDGEPGLKRHVGTNHVFEQNGERVIVKSILTVFEGDGAPAIVATADIRDELVREAGNWRIVRHVVTMDPGTRAAMSEGQGD